MLMHFDGLLQDQKIAEAKKNVQDAQRCLEEKMMEKLENGLRNRQEQINQLLERLKEHVITILIANSHS